MGPAVINLGFSISIYSRYRPDMLQNQRRSFFFSMLALQILTAVIVAATANRMQKKPSTTDYKMMLVNIAMCAALLILSLLTLFAWRGNAGGMIIFMILNICYAALSIGFAAAVTGPPVSVIIFYVSVVTGLINLAGLICFAISLWVAFRTASA